MTAKKTTPRAARKLSSDALKVFQILDSEEPVTVKSVANRLGLYYRSVQRMFGLYIQRTGKTPHFEETPRPKGYRGPVSTIFTFPKEGR